MKLYGWEIAFKRIIQKIREQEIGHLKSLALGRAFERGLAHSIGFIGSFVMLVLASEVNHHLSFTLIFSTLELVTYLRSNMIILTLGVGLYYEIQVVCGRFASIFNVNFKSMIPIDEEKKQPQQ